MAELRPVDDSGTSASGQTVSGDVPVSFASGASGATLSGTLEPQSSVRYILGADDGQFLDVNVQSQGGALDYKILNPDGSALLDLISSDTPYRGQLWQSGDHVIEVMNAGAQSVNFDARFDIN